MEISQKAALGRVGAAEAANPPSEEPHRIVASALLAAVAQMIQRRQYDAAYWTMRDLCNREEARLGFERDAYIHALLDLMYVLDGLRNGMRTAT